jgi:hypothetical protein
MNRKERNVRLAMRRPPVHNVLTDTAQLYTILS